MSDFKGRFVFLSGVFNFVKNFDNVEAGGVSGFFNSDFCGAQRKGLLPSQQQQQ